MALIDLITSEGHTLKRKTAKEWAGPCPSCGGRDRFIVTPEKDLWWCRQCNKGGDSIAFLRHVKGLSYGEACRQLGREFKGTWRPLQHKKEVRPHFTPRETQAPGALWQQQAGAFLEQAQKHLWGHTGQKARAFLYSRGLKDGTIRQAGLGWNPADVYHDRQAWGLEPETNDQGKPKKLWTPAGLVIPLIENGQPVRLRIRRTDPGDGQRYFIVNDSDTRPMAWGLEKKAFCIIESELDGLLVQQAAGDLVGVVAMGSAQARPDRETHEVLKQASIILVCLDSDAAGAKVSWQFWPDTYKHVKRWPTPLGKDPGAAHEKGLNIRAWIMAGLNVDPDRTQDKITFRLFPGEWLKQFDEMQLERLAIMTVDGGLSDSEALKYYGANF